MRGKGKDFLQNKQEKTEKSAEISPKQRKVPKD